MPDVCLTPYHTSNGHDWLIYYGVADWCFTPVKAEDRSFIGHAPTFAEAKAKIDAIEGEARS